MSLDTIIPPEIKNDKLYYDLILLVKENPIRHILEIGASSGDGSTEAFVKGIEESGRKTVTVHSIEISKKRYAAFTERYKGNKHVKGYNLVSIPPSKFMKPEEVEEFYNNTPTNLNKYPLEMVLGWLKTDLDYIKKNKLKTNGIEAARKASGRKNFDLVLIDGSAFTGESELDAVIGAKFIVLDDINDIKNHANYIRLNADPNYDMIKVKMRLRNGYAIYKRKK